MAGQGDTPEKWRPEGRGPGVSAADPMPIAVVALGFSQIITWGTTFYVLGVLGPAVGREMGWSASVVLSGYAVALLIGSVTSATAGMILDTYGARVVMTAGSVAVALGLWAVSVASDITSYLAAWAYIGIAMRLTLYDAAFTALVQVAPSRGRRAISYLMLFAGFASTVFWPITHVLEQRIGWRDTLAVFALVNLVVCVPLHWFGISGTPEGPEHAGAAGADGRRVADSPPLEGRARSMAIAMFAVVLSLIAFVFGVISLQLVRILEHAGLGPTLAVGVAAMMGVSQSAGRIVELAWGRHLHPIAVSRIAIAALAGAMLLLVASSGNFIVVVLFTVLMGAAQGVISVARGAVPLALFGPAEYGRVLGVMSAPVMMTNACSPAAYALLAERVGAQHAILSLLLAAGLASLMMEVMAAWYRRHTGG